MEPIYSQVKPEEHDDALDHWDCVFDVGRTYFEHYYTADPWYRAGDTFGCWVDGKIVSAVHVCRRPLEWDGRTALCGGIANVATHPDHRKGGLSGELLKMAVAHMEREGFAFSCLGTGLYGHYGRFGWEQHDMPRYLVTPTGAPRACRLTPQPAIPGPEVQAIYARNTRPLRLPRTAGYSEKWVAWFWAGETTELLLDPGRAYAVVRFPEEVEKPALVMEWQAVDASAEREILAETMARAQAAGRRQVHFEGQPQHGGRAALEEFGDVSLEPDKWHMFRRFNLSEADYAEVLRLYVSGEAAWWHGDGF